MQYKILMILALAVFCTGCIPNNLRSDPVFVETEQGTVTCQLYWTNYVGLDRAEDYPATMTPGEANEICLQEGIRLEEELRLEEIRSGF